MSKRNKYRGKNYQPQAKRKPQHSKPVTPESKSPAELSIENRNVRKTRKVIFSILWIIISINIFLVDYDYLLLNKVFEIRPILYSGLRFIGLVSILLITWFLLGTGRFWRNFGRFLLFPLFPILAYSIKYIIWDLPKILWKKKLYYSFYVYIDTFASIFLNFRSHLTRIILFLIATIVMFVFSNEALFISITFFTVTLIWHLVNRFRETFEPVRIYQLNFEQLNGEQPFSGIELSKSVETAVAKTDKTKKQLKMARMEQVLFIRELVLLFNKNITAILRTKSYYKGILFKALYSMVIAMFSLGGINYCIYVLYPQLFTVEGEVFFFDFFYYSFFTLIPDSTDIEPASNVTKVIKMVGVGIGVYINIVILVLLITVRTSRYSENLQKVSKISAEFSQEITEYFISKYQKDPKGGLKWLLEKESKVAEALVKFGDWIRM